MFESIMENFKFMDEGAQQGIVFALGIAIYYVISKMFSRK